MNPIVWAVAIAIGLPVIINPNRIASHPAIAMIAKAGPIIGMNANIVHHLLF
jgi:hypothetical protein